MSTPSRTPFGGHARQPAAPSTLRRWLGLVALVLTLVVALTPLSAQTAGAAVGDCTPSPSWGTVDTSLAAQVVQLVNQHRAGMGLVTLSNAATLTASAEWKSLHMAGTNYFDHNDRAPPVARTVSERLEACGYPSRSAGWGENIAYGYTTAAAVMNAWLNSSGHRANIENPSFRTIGVGVARNGSGPRYWTQNFGTTGATSQPPPPPGPPLPPPPPPAGPPPPPAPPGAPTGLSTSSTQTAITLSWQAPAGMAVNTYSLWQNDVWKGTNKTTSYTFSGLACGTTYKLTVAAYDANWAMTAQSSVSVSTAACQAPPPPPPPPPAGPPPPPAAPPAPPGAPTGLSTSSTQTAITLSWQAPAGMAVNTYSLWQNDVWKGTNKTTSYTFSGLACGTTYKLTVAAYDAVWAMSPQSSVSASTSACSSGG